MAFAYFRSDEINPFYVHVSTVNNKKIVLHYHKSFKLVPDADKTLSKWKKDIKEITCVRSKQKHVKEKKLTIRRKGKGWFHKVFLIDVFGKKYVGTNVPHIIQGNIEFYVSYKCKLVEITVELYGQYILPLIQNLKIHPDFGTDPNKESMHQPVAPRRRMPPRTAHPCLLQL